MDTLRFQLQAHSFADYTQPYVRLEKDAKEIRVDYVYPVMGLAEESGELVGKFAKAVRDNNGIIAMNERKRF